MPHVSSQIDVDLQISRPPLPSQFIHCFELCGYHFGVFLPFRQPLKLRPLNFLSFVDLDRCFVALSCGPQLLVVCFPRGVKQLLNPFFGSQKLHTLAFSSVIAAFVIASSAALCGFPSQAAMPLITALACCTTP